MSSLPTANLYYLYHAWMDRIASHQASKLTGEFHLPTSRVGVVALAEGLSNHARLEKEVASLRAEAKRQRQISRRVELNSRIAELKKEMATICDGLARPDVP